VLAARAGGEDVVFIYNLYPKSLFGLVVPEESEVQSPEELKGTVVGVGTADGAEVAFVRTIFNDLGMEAGTDYEFLPIGDGGTASAAFLREEVESYAAAISDAAIITAAGIPLREITPEEYLGYFGNGVAALASYIEANPDVIEGFGRAMVRGMRFTMDEANRDAVLAHTAAGNPQEGENKELASALLSAVIDRTTPTDAYMDQGFGYQPPEHWELWHESMVNSDALAEPLPDLSEAYTNEFVETWNQDS
jgi:NitT/TauT family transport system substrate-binding protein